MSKLVTLPPFVTIEHPIELKGKILILQTTPPYMIGQIWKFDSQQRMDEWLDRNSALNVTEIPGYRMLVVDYGNLQEPTEPNHYFNMGNAIYGMASFYLDTRINTFPQGFTRYKI